MSSNVYTIKQLSDELGVTKPGIRKLMNSSFRKRYTSTTGNRILINEAGAKVIRDHFSNSKVETKDNSSQKQSQTVSSNDNDKVLKAKNETIALLKAQLKAKDDQLANMQKLMDQNQQLLLNTQSENKHLLALTHDSKSNDSQVQDGEYKETETDRKPETETSENSNEANGSKYHKRWWKRIPLIKW